MSASIVTNDQFRHRREVKNLEEAVRRANSERNNVVMIGANAFDRSDYFFARSPEEQRLRHVPLEKTQMPESWASVIFNALCLAAFVAACIVGLPLVLG